MSRWTIILMTLNNQDSQYYRWSGFFEIYSKVSRVFPALAQMYPTMLCMISAFFWITTSQYKLVDLTDATAIDSCELKLLKCPFANQTGVEFLIFFSNAFTLNSGIFIS